MKKSKIPQKVPNKKITMGGGKTKFALALSLCGSLSFATVTNPAGTTLDVLDATASNDPKLENYGTLTGKTYPEIAGMYGYHNTGTINYDFLNDGKITAISTNNNAYGMSASGTGNHTLTNSGTIIATANGTAYGMFASGTGNHTLTNSGTIIATSKDRNAYGMHVDGTGTHTISNTGFINARGVKAYEVFGDGNATLNIKDFATTLRTFTTTDSVFGGSSNNTTINLNNSRLIFRPEQNGLNKDYSLTNLVFTDVAKDVALGKITTEVPFLKAVVTGDGMTATTSVRLEANVNSNTVQGATSSLQSIGIVQGQMNNIATNLNKQTANTLFAKAQSDDKIYVASSDLNGIDIFEKDKKWQSFADIYVSDIKNSKYNYNGNASGIFGGVNYRSSDKLIIGGHFDFNFSKLDQDSLDTNTDSKSLAFGLHSSYALNPSWYISAQLTGALSKSNSDYALLGDTTDATVDTNTIYTSIDTGYLYTILKDKNIEHTLTPQIALSYLYMKNDSYDITWSNPALAIYNISYDSNKFDAVYLSPNINYKATFTTQDDYDISLLANLGARVNLTDDEIENSFRLLGDNFTTISTEDRTTATTNLGVELKEGDISIGLNYDGAYGSNQKVHSGRISFKYDF